MHGVPFDVAFAIDDVTRAAFCIIISELNGMRFDWASMRFEESRE